MGLIVAVRLGYEPQGPAVQVAALGAALAGALVLNWTDKRWPDVQEGIIGVTFVLAANVAILLMAADPHGAEHLKDLLVGQILWADTGRLAVVAVLYANILAFWFWVCGGWHAGFFILFSFALTASGAPVRG